MAVVQLLSACLDGFANYLARRAAIVSLHELDDRALRDIGLHRSQVEAAVRGFVRLPRPNSEMRTASPGAVGGPMSSLRRAFYKHRKDNTNALYLS